MPTQGVGEHHGITLQGRRSGGDDRRHAGMRVKHRKDCGGTRPRHAKSPMWLDLLAHTHSNPQKTYQSLPIR